MVNPPLRLPQFSRSSLTDKGKVIDQASVSMSRWELEGKDDAPWSAINMDDNGELQHSVGDGKNEKESSEVPWRFDAGNGVGEGNVCGSWHHGLAGTFVGIGAEDLVGVGNQFEV